MKTAKTKTTPTVFHRTSFTERLVFMNKPDRDTRLALRAAGFHWNVGGGYWWRHQSSMEPLKPSELADVLTPAPVTEAEQAATA